MNKDIKEILVGENHSGGSTGQHFVDIHCHCLPGIDDGPATMSESINLCKALAADGIATVIATPHQLGRFSGSNLSAQVRQGIVALNEELKNNNIEISIVPGGDVRVDEMICSLVEDDEILTLADGGKYILLELPHTSFIDIEPLIVELKSAGIESIISHPERHPILPKRPEVLCKWLELSAHFQITASSLLGMFGSRTETKAWQMLSSGIVTIVATDAHDLAGRRPCMKQAYERIEMELGESIARLVCIENPLRVLNGRPIIPVDSARAVS